jgi:hypothetical protein
VEKQNLFRGAIMESGAPSGYVYLDVNLSSLLTFVLLCSDGVPPPAYLEPAYQALVTIVGCGPTLANGTSLPCLRSIPTGKLFNATLYLLSQGTEALPFNRVQDGYFHDAAPSVQVRTGKVANVPLIIGASGLLPHADLEDDLWVNVIS